jgi:hypothetical protein
MQADHAGVRWTALTFGVCVVSNHQSAGHRDSKIAVSSSRRASELSYPSHHGMMSAPTSSPNTSARTVTTAAMSTTLDARITATPLRALGTCSMSFARPDLPFG